MSLDSLQGAEVEVYWNSRKKLFSVRYKGKVVAHAAHITLNYPKFIVKQNGRKRVLETKQKNVHAWVKGYVTQSWHSIGSKEYFTIWYNPQHCVNFEVWKNKRSLEDCIHIKLDNNGNRPTLIGGFK